MFWSLTHCNKRGQWDRNEGPSLRRRAKQRKSVMRNQAALSEQEGAPWHLRTSGFTCCSSLSRYGLRSCFSTSMPTISSCGSPDICKECQREGGLSLVVPRECCW